jgi:hypothetical protein
MDTSSTDAVGVVVRNSEYLNYRAEAPQIPVAGILP